MSGFATWSAWVGSGEWADGSDSAMPMLPALAADVMSLAIDPDVSVARIARVIAKDQVLATRVLRLANSAYCAPMQEVTTVNDAIVRMGTGPVRNVVLAVCFASRLQGARRLRTAGSRSDGSRHRHGVSCATGGREAWPGSCS